MPLEEVRASGTRALVLATQLLQRARRTDPDAGLWEAADVQWWSRTPRLSDDVEKLFWVDDHGPVAGILLTSGADGSWQCDPVVTPGASRPRREVVWDRASTEIARRTDDFAIPVRDDDLLVVELARRDGLTASYHDSTAWMDAADRPKVQSPASGFHVVDRARHRNSPHPLLRRSGGGVAQRLEQCSLYDPALDLSVVAAGGRVAGYSLYWLDPITRVGLVEPVRVEDEFQRQGLARAMLTAGIARLVDKGVQRVKISYGSDAAAALYEGIGFRRTSTATWYANRPAEG